jgi:hypothetical protein
MNRRHLMTALAAACCGGAGALVPPTPAAAREVAAWFVRPALLPFAWRAVAEASRAGDAAEVFARGQQVLNLLPTWTDGQIAFACAYALGGDDAAAGATARATAAAQRLRVAMAWLEAARPAAGRRELDLLQALAMLPEVAARQSPEIAELLQRTGFALSLSDFYLAAAERLFPSAAVREQRTFLGPRLAASLLAAGERRQAILVLETAIARAAEVRDQPLATEWRARLTEVVRALGGEPVDLEAVRADSRMAPLLPHLR